MTRAGPSLWSRIAKLPLLVEGYELEPLEADESRGYERTTTQIRLLGCGSDGLGEDVSPFADENKAFIDAGASLPLAGEWTLGRFCAHLAALDQWPAPPKWEQEKRYRNWAFESAALDLAVRQAGHALHEILECEPRSVRFVNSLGLGEPPAIDPIHRRIARSPGLRFKLDAVATWTPELVAELAATRAVETIDFKGQYGFDVDDAEALTTMYALVRDAFPNALLEDPHSLPEITALLTPCLDRVAYDAPIHEADDIAATPLAARIVNVKPSRVGGLRPLLDIYDHCAAHGLRMYGGGMGELGVGRIQIQLLASLFHGDAPNDVAPTAYNDLDPPAGLPPSPLPAPSGAIGFR